MNMQNVFKIIILGKTTALSILTGLFPPSGGTDFITTFKCPTRPDYVLFV